MLPGFITHEDYRQLEQQKRKYDCSFHSFLAGSAWLSQRH